MKGGEVRIGEDKEGEKDTKRRGDKERRDEDGEEKGEKGRCGEQNQGMALVQV